jgi:hypothetical protein
MTISSLDVSRSKQCFVASNCIINERLMYQSFVACYLINVSLLWFDRYRIVLRSHRRLLVCGRPVVPLPQVSSIRARATLVVPSSSCLHAGRQPRVHVDPLSTSDPSTIN